MTLMEKATDATKSYLPIVAVVSIVAVAVGIGFGYGVLTNRIDTIASNQISKEDVRTLLKENNEELKNSIKNEILVSINQDLKKND